MSIQKKYKEAKENYNKLTKDENKKSFKKNMEKLQTENTNKPYLRFRMFIVELEGKV